MAAEPTLENAGSLGKRKNVQAVRLDVTKPDDIEAARKVIERGHPGLYGLVNNAGVVTIGNVVLIRR